MIRGSSRAIRIASSSLLAKPFASPSQTPIGGTSCVQPFPRRWRSTNFSNYSDRVSRPRGARKTETKSASGSFSSSTEQRMSTDAKMRLFEEQLVASAAKGEILKVLDACKAIKERLLELNQRSRTADEVKPSRLVHLMLLKALAFQGNLTACYETLRDMEYGGHRVEIDHLNWVLKAAVVDGQLTEIERVLESIAQFEPSSHGQSNAETEEKEAESSSIDVDGPLLSLSFTRNWTIETYQHLLHHCQHVGNLEYALVLLGSASQRSVVEATKSMTGTVQALDRKHRRSFFAEVMDRPTMRSVLSLAQECRQARLLVDLAIWLDTAAARRIDPSMWMEVLRCCANEDWWPGIAVGWKRAVQDSLLIPDEGLFLSVILSASRSRKTDFLRDALSYYKQKVLPAGTDLQEWHYTPLLDAQCAQHDFRGAFQTATHIARLGHESPLAFLTRSLTTAAGEGFSSLIRAYLDFLEAGRDTTLLDGGVTVAAMNALLRAANKLEIPTLAFRLYAARHYLRSDRSTMHVELPDMPLLFRAPFEDTTGLDLETWKEKQNPHHLLADLQAWEQQFQMNKTDKTTDMTLKPDIETFNILLATAHIVQSREIGQYVFDCINRANVQVNALTYEEAVYLALLESSYEEAFELLEECKSRPITPTIRTYRALADRCLKEEDDRWVTLCREMIELKYYPGAKLMDAMRKGDWLDTQKPLPFRESPPSWSFANRKRSLLRRDAHVVR